MIINGKEIDFFIKRAKVPERYYEVLTREVRLTLNNLYFIKEVRTKRSRSTDSIYFTIQIKHIKQKYTISIRSHFPLERHEYYLYYFTPRFNNLADLTQKIEDDLVKIYNQKAVELGISLADYSSKKISYETNKKKLKKDPVVKLKGTKAHFENLQQESFEDFLAEFNQTSKKEDKK